MPAVLFEGWTQHLVKAGRGARQGNYALVIELDPATRDRYRPVDNQISKEGQRIVDTLADGIARFATYSPTIPGVHTVYSDSVVFEQAHAGQGGLP